MRLTLARQALLHVRRDGLGQLLDPTHSRRSAHPGALNHTPSLLATKLTHDKARKTPRLRFFRLSNTTTRPDGSICCGVRAKASEIRQPVACRTPQKVCTSRGALAAAAMKARRSSSVTERRRPSASNSGMPVGGRLRPFICVLYHRPRKEARRT